MTDPRYPVGRFEWPKTTPTAAQRATWINDLANLPAQLLQWVATAPPAALDTTYREGGWTARQLIHHFADSHLNSYARFRLALTEDKPTIKPYDEKAWAELPDGKSAPVELSLALIEGLHQRWVLLLKSLSEEQWHREFVHPEHGAMALDSTLAMYAWHCRHHLGHLAMIRAKV